jgi:hypothetical protein
VTILKNWWYRYREGGKIMAPVGVELQPIIGNPWPFKYNAPRDYRTIVGLAKRLGFTDAQYDAAKGAYTAHNAVEDACAQARAVIACEQYLHREAGPAAGTSVGSWRNGIPL